MSALRRLLHRAIATARAIGGSNRADADLRAELESHLAMQIDDNVRRGMSPADARRAALLASGGLTLAAELTRERRGIAWVDEIVTDVRHAARALRAKPGFTIAAVATLGLAVGANAAMFTIVNAVVLRPLPYPDPDRIIAPSLSFQGTDHEVVDEPVYFAWTSSARRVILAAYANARGVVAMPSGPEEIRGMEVTAPYFAVFRVRPLLGRTFAGEDDRPAAAPVVVISEQLWRRAFASDSAVVGRPMIIDGKAATVIGVVPTSFAAPAHAEYWRPYALTPSTNGVVFFYQVVGRVRDGFTLAEAEAELAAITARVDAARPPDDRGLTTVVATLHERRYGDRRKPLFLLFAAVGVLLLIACANLANLSLARATARQREVAVRLALGAARWRLVRYMVVESLLLAAAGGALGLVLSEAAVRYFTRLSPAAVGDVDGIRADATVLLFTLSVAIATAIVMGLIPAAATAREDLARALSAGSARSGTSVRQHLVRRALVVGQLATALVLLTAAGLVARTFARVAAIDPGFAPDGLVAATVRLPEPRYSEATAAPFFDALLDRVRRLPGVDAAALADVAPLSGLRLNFSTKDSAGRETPRIDVVAVGPDYFRTIGARILAGRPLDETDRRGAERVVVVNRTLARQLFGRASAVGKTIDYHGRATIVGVVSDVLQRELETAPVPLLYPPLAQEGTSTHIRILARTAGSLSALEAAMAQATRSLDASLPPPRVVRMDEHLAEAVAPRKFTFLLLGAFAGLAAALAVVGLYGLLAHLVSDRTREIGIRAALGADRTRVVRFVLGQGLVLVVIGVAAGLAGAAALTRVVASLLYGVGPRDPFIFTIVPLVLGGVAMVATLIPAVRAARVDPVVALRAD